MIYSIRHLKMGVKKCLNLLIMDLIQIAGLGKTENRIGMDNRTFYFTSLRIATIERFSIECRKTETKVITLANHNRCKQHNEPIRIRSKYM